MWIFQQKNPNYWNKDLVWIMRDIALVIETWSQSAQLRNIFKARAASILSEKPESWWVLRNNIFGSNHISWNRATNDHNLRLANIDSTNLEYVQLIIMRNMFNENPNLTLNIISNKLQEIFDAYWISTKNITTLEHLVSRVDQENFEQVWKYIKHKWHIWKILFVKLNQVV